MKIPKFLRFLGLVLLTAATAQAQAQAQVQVQRYMVNPSFESPALGGSACYGFTASASVTGWTSTELIGVASNTLGSCTSGQEIGANAIEIWRNNFNGVAAYAGSQHVELNAHNAARLSQTICMQTGDEVTWAYSHRARATNAENATFSVGGAINAVHIARTDTNGGVSTSSCITNNSLITGATCVGSGNPTTKWGRYTGSFTWQGGGGNQSIGFEATNGGSIGNFLDDVQFTVKPRVEFPSADLPILESAGTANFQLRVVGRVPVGGMVVPFTITGTATGGGVDYTLPNTFTVPAGDYAVGATVNVPVLLNSDSLAEDAETVIIAITPPAASAAYRLGSTVSCGGTTIGRITLAITDDDVSVTLNKALLPVSDSGLFDLSITDGSPTGGTNLASNQGNGGSTGAVRVNLSTLITLAETAGTSTSLANYTTAFSCVDGSATSVPVAGSGTSRTITTPVLTASAAARTITCTYTNTSKLATITLKKALAGDRMAVNDQFSVAIRTGGVTGAVVSSATTTGTMATVTAGTTGSFSATVGTAYTLTEAAAAGASLANYSAALTCVDNAGVQTGLPTGVAFNPAVGYPITPVAGAALSCTITNTPVGASITGRVFVDNGVSSGIANDGLINGSEAGLAGITVHLTNCAAIVYASGTTDGAGAYNLGVPTTIAAPASLCVEQPNLGMRISTGASASSIALPSDTPTTVASISYTYTSTPNRIAFAFNGTGHSNLNFGLVPPNTLAPNGAQTAQPGTVVFYAHVFYAGSAGSITFSLAGASTPSTPAWSQVLYQDVGCTGTLTAASPLITALVNVTAGQTLCVSVKQFVPASAALGAQNTVTLSALFSYTGASPALSRTLSATDVTTVDEPGALALIKRVSNLTQGGPSGLTVDAKPGETLQYLLTAINNGSEPLSLLVINDATPAFTTFYSAACPATLTNGLTACSLTRQPAVGAAGSVQWTFTGSLSPSGQLSVSYEVKVNN